MRFSDKLQQRSINRLIELHNLNYSKVNFNVLDRKHAIYYLQGAAITSAINVRKLKNEVGMIGREWRYACELSYTTGYIDELSDESQILKEWFTRDGYIKRRPLKKGKIDSSKRQEKSQLSSYHFELYDRLYKETKDELSKFAHATFKSTRGNTKMISKTFNYYHDYDETDPVGLEQLKGTFVSEAIMCFLLPTESLPLTEEQFSELLSYKKMLNKLFAKVSSLTL